MPDACSARRPPPGALLGGGHIGWRFHTGASPWPLWVEPQGAVTLWQVRPGPSLRPLRQQRAAQTARRCHARRAGGALIASLCGDRRSRSQAPQRSVRRDACLRQMPRRAMWPGPLAAARAALACATVAAIVGLASAQPPPPQQVALGNWSSSQELEGEELGAMFGYSVRLAADAWCRRAVRTLAQPCC